MGSETEPDDGPLTISELLILGLALLAATTLIGIFVWGIRDADREAAARLVADTAAPQILDVRAGWFSATAEAEFAAFYPALVRAHPGDTIRFTNPTIEDPHSVTFGMQRDRSNQPRFGTGDPLPHINGPCVSDGALTISTVACDGLDDAASLPAYDGQPYFNSGIIPPGGGVFELRLATDLAPGRYEFVCVIHPLQVGTLEVVARGEPTQRPSDLDAAAEEAFGDDSEALKALRWQTRTARDPQAVEIQAGSASARASFNVFFPGETTIDTGQSVTWVNSGPVPHVMVFGGYLSPPEALESPPTRPSGSALLPGVFTSGPVGEPPYPRTSFTVRFDDPGSYPYVCTLHPGMAGTVTVR